MAYHFLFCSNFVAWYQSLNLNKITMTVHWLCPLMPNKCATTSVNSKFITECYSGLTNEPLESDHSQSLCLPLRVIYLGRRCSEIVLRILIMYISAHGVDRKKRALLLPQTPVEPLQFSSPWMMYSRL